MNVFPLEKKSEVHYEQSQMPCPILSAQSQCDKHIVKMPIESAQMLSTAYRMLDGKLTTRPSKSGKRIVKYWDLYEGIGNLELENTLYKAVHMYHPCTVWTMKTEANYRWHWEHFRALCREYTYRYGKIHGSEKLLEPLRTPPKNIPHGPFTQMPLAMKSNPECMKDDVVESYRMFYKTKQERFDMKWTRRTAPDWFNLKTG